MVYQKEDLKELMKKAVSLVKNHKNENAESYLQNFFHKEYNGINPEEDYKIFREYFSECALGLIQENFSDEYVERLMKDWNDWKEV